MSIFFHKLFKKKSLSLILITIFQIQIFFAQTAKEEELVTTQKKEDQEVYPKIVGYMGILHPLLTYEYNGNTHTNFKTDYSVGFPTGINIIKSKHLGFSFEFVPMIKTDKTSSKMANFTFHPGLIYRIKHGFSIVTRLAFETSGRYGFTPIFNKVVLKKKTHNYFVAVPFPVRFGNNKPSSFTLGLQFGVGF